MLQSKVFQKYLSNQVKVFAKYAYTNLQERPEKAANALEILKLLLKKTLAGPMNEQEKILCQEVFKRTMADLNYQLVREAIGDLYDA
jgi:hypothetical protein